MTPLPEPPCIDYHVWIWNIDQCCPDLFNVTLSQRRVEELKLELKSERKEFIRSEIQSQITLREETLQNFTMDDCRLSALHLPQDASPRTSFDLEDTCCSLGYCIEFTSDGLPLSFSSAVTGIRSLSPTSLARNSPSCPSTDSCKRQSLARPGEIICCLLIRAPWGRGRVAICPNSCD